MKQEDFAILAAVICVALGICAAMFLRPSQAEGVDRVEFISEPSEASFTAPKDPEPTSEPQGEPEGEPQEELQEQADSTVEQVYAEYQEAPYQGAYYAEYDPMYNENGPTREMPGWYDGYLETYYSDTVARHYMSDQWNVDDEGFYRDQDGRYIIGVDISEGIELGTEVETGKGLAVVMDYGSGAHVHDFYVSGW